MISDFTNATNDQDRIQVIGHVDYGTVFGEKFRTEFAFNLVRKDFNGFPEDVAAQLKMSNQDCETTKSMG